MAKRTTKQNPVVVDPMDQDDVREEMEEIKDPARFRALERLAKTMTDAAVTLYSEGRGYGTPFTPKVWLDDLSAALQSSLRRMAPLYVKLNRLGLIQISRFDMTDQDPAKSDSSEIRSMGATFNFFNIPNKLIKNPCCDLENNPSDDAGRAPTLSEWYKAGERDAQNAIELDYFDPAGIARQVLSGKDRGGLIRAAVDVYFREAEDADSKKEWFSQNADELEDAPDKEKAYEAWKRGWRDAAVSILDGLVANELA